MAGTFFDGAQGGKYHLEEYKGKKPGFYEVEGGKIKVDKDGKVTFYKSGPVPKSFSDTYTEEPETPETPDTETRTSPVTGITQTGKKLGIGDINGLFASLSDPDRKGGALMTAGELPSASKFFSEALVTTPQSQYQGGDLKISTDDTGYEVGAPVSKGTKIDGSQVSYKDVPGYEVPETSVPMTTGRDGNDAQEGVSDKSDIAEEVRTIRMNRNSGRGSRRDPRNRGGGSDEPFGGVSETKGNGMTKERMAARAAFLDPSNKGYGAIRAADRAVGAYHQYDTGGMNIDGKDVKFNEGMSRDARYELRGGGIQSKEDAQEFLKKYTSALASTDTTPEPPASEQTPTTLTPETPRNPSTATKPSNPTIIDSTASHPDTLRKPDAATEASNREYASTKFKFDPEKGMMVPVQ